LNLNTKKNNTPS